MLTAHFSKIVLKYSNEVHLLRYLTPLDFDDFATPARRQHGWCRFSRPSKMAFLVSFLPNILLLPNNEDDLLVMKMLENWSLQIVRKGI
jgi:hypothetical protein